MKISELIKQLQAIQEQSGDIDVLMSSDPEGNSYHKLTDDVFSDICVYADDDNYGISVYEMEWDASDAGMDEDEWAECKVTNPKCVVIYP